MVPAALILFVASAAAISSTSQEAGGEEPARTVPEAAGPETPPPLVRKTREDGQETPPPAAPRGQDGPVAVTHGPVLPAFVAYGSPLAPAQVIYRSSPPYSLYYLPQSGITAKTMAAVPATTNLLDLSLDTPHASLHKGLLIQHSLAQQQQQQQLQQQQQQLQQQYSHPSLAYCRALLGQTDMAALSVQPQLPPPAQGYQHYTSYMPAY